MFSPKTEHFDQNLTLKKNFRHEIDLTMKLTRNPCIGSDHETDRRIVPRLGSAETCGGAAPEEAGFVAESAAVLLRSLRSGELDDGENGAHQLFRRRQGRRRRHQTPHQAQGHSNLNN